MSPNSDSKNSYLISHDPLENILAQHIDDFVAGNQAAKIVAKGLSILGIGLRPLIDHITFRALDIDTCVNEFIRYGYQCDESVEVMEYESWTAKVYRKAGYPVIFIVQAYKDERGQNSLISEWVQKFGDKRIHHLAIQVDEITQAIYYLEKQGVRFSGSIIGARNTNLRQVFAQPEEIDGMPFTVLELVERHCGYTGFSSPQTEGVAEVVSEETAKKRQTE
ncbi:MAG: hypothetical protein H6757_01585 [Candidatus Omnitrophica bacterium]|nr:hypothetical protein [Candidatus Omnitrophota bacterium]